MTCFPASMAHGGGEWMPRACRIFAGSPANQPSTVCHTDCRPSHRPAMMCWPSRSSHVPALANFAATSCRMPSHTPAMSCWPRCARPIVFCQVVSQIDAT